MSFDPNSTDAMFAKVLAKLDEQAAMLSEIRENSRLTEAEIAGLKSWRDEFKGKITILAVLASFGATLLMHWLLSMFPK